MNACFFNAYQIYGYIICKYLCLMSVYVLYAMQFIKGWVESKTTIEKQSIDI